MRPPATAGLAAAERGRDAGVAVDDEARAPVDEDLLDPADRIERAGERVLLRLGVDPPVRRVGEELVGRLLTRVRDPVAPRGAAAIAAAISVPLDAVQRRSVPLTGR